MEIIEKRTEKTLLLELKGELDHHGAKEALEKIGYSCDAALPNHAVLDFAGVTFMDSSGIALVMHTQRRMQLLRGSVTLQNVPAQAMRVFDAAGISKIIKIL